MLSRIGGHLTYANVAATLALLFAMSGGAMAARHFLITSTKQISPQVLHALKGKNGKNGATGPQGPVGPQGAQGALGPQGAKGENGKDGTPGPEGPPGPEGSPWTLGGTLPSGASEKGVWVARGHATEAENVSAAVSLPIPLKEPVTVGSQLEFVQSGVTSSCPGGLSKPEAAPGHLCVFMKTDVNVEPSSVIFSNPEGGFEELGTTGDLLVFKTEAVGPYNINGTWVVTAP
jgi:hypothetical protein